MLTGINEAHLERFKSLQNTISTKFEIVEHAKEDALLVINGDDQRVRENAEAYARGRTIAWFGQAADARFRAEGVRFDAEAPGIRLVLSGPEGRVGEFVLPFLAPYAASLAQAAATVGAHLGMNMQAISKGISEMRPVAHRLRLSSTENDIWIIDDSYNGNPEGVEAALSVLQALEGRRRIYVTPGLVEMGEQAGEVHRAIGRKLAKSAELVALVRNSVTPEIAKGLAEAGFSPERILWFETGGEMYQRLPGMFRAGDVILFQNDWPENYS